MSLYLTNGNVTGVNGLTIYDSANKAAKFWASGNELYYNTSIIQGLNGGDSNFKVQNTASGTSSLYLATNGTLNSRLYSDALGNLNLQSYTGTSYIKFYCGSTAYYQVTNAGGANVSDARFKTNVSNITDAISKVSGLQGVYFSMVDDTTNRMQMGLIANSVLPVVPEVVIIDNDGDDDDHGGDDDDNDTCYLCYDKLVALLMKEQQIMIDNNISSISSLNTRLSILENV
jgi:hypothetical protein